MPIPHNAVMLADLHRYAVQIADDEARASIECNALQAEAPWWDVQPMLDPNEHAMPVIDLHRVHLDYARLRGLIEVHPDVKHLVRLVRPRTLPERQLNDTGETA
jgi:hypothetical protein